MTSTTASSLSPGAMAGLLKMNTWPSAQRLATLSEEALSHLSEWEEQRVVTRYHTVIGPVIALNEYARDVIATVDDQIAVPWLYGPSAVADRAYQYDAVTHLESLGYVRHGELYKIKSLGVRGNTSQIKALQMILPGYLQKRVEAGEIPRLHATIAQGGATPSMAKNLVKLHNGSATRWKHPVLVAVPSITKPLARAAAQAKAFYRCDILRYIEIPVI